MKNNEQKNETMLREAPIGKLLLKLTTPAIFSVLMYNLYNIIDTIYIGRWVGTQAMGGLSIAFPFQMILGAVASTSGAGAASVISRCLGKKDYEKANNAAGNTFIIFWSIALLLTAVGLIFLNPLLHVLGTTEEIFNYAKDYLTIILLGTVFSTGFSSIIRAEGNVKFSMYLWIVPIFVNIVLDPIFIFGFRMGVKGAALATVISQITAFSMSMYYFFLSGKTSLKITLSHLKPNFILIKEILIVGAPSFFRQITASLSMIIINNFLRHYGGDLAISTNGILGRINMFIYIPIYGFSQAFQPIVGYNYGSENYTRVKQTVKYSAIITSCYGILTFLIIQLFPGLLIGIFSKDQELITLGSRVFRIFNLFLPLFSAQFLTPLYFQSIGKPSKALLLMLLNQYIIYFPIVIIMSKLYGLDGIWFSTPINALFSFVIALVFILKDLKTLDKRISAKEST